MSVLCSAVLLLTVTLCISSGTVLMHPCQYCRRARVIQKGANLIKPKPQVTIKQHTCISLSSQTQMLVITMHVTAVKLGCQCRDLIWSVSHPFPNLGWSCFFMVRYWVIDASGCLWRVLIHLLFCCHRLHRSSCDPCRCPADQSGWG